RFGSSTPSDLRRFAGRPDGSNSVDGGDSNGTSYSAKILFYNSPDHGFTSYYFVNPDGAWVFDGFESTLQRFHTAHGTKAGMSVGAAEKREKIGRTSTFCIGPALLRKGQGALLGVVISRSRVSDLFAIGPYPFGFC